LRAIEAENPSKAENLSRLQPASTQNFLILVKKKKKTKLT